MKQWAITLPLILSVAANVACSSSSSNTAKPKGTAGAAGAAGGGTSGSGGSGGSGMYPDEVLLPIGPTGYMSMPSLGIQGAWYAYGDSIGSTGMPPGDCQNAGHADAECSSITSPMAGTFPQTVPGAMETTGTVEKVIDIVGQSGCPMTSASCDYSKMWGAGIGVDLNNPGNADGGTAMKNPYNATMNKVVGVAFDATLASDLPGMRVEFPMPTTTDTAHIYKPGMASQNYVSPVVAGHNRIMFASDLSQPDYVSTTQMVNFDPTQMLSIQFHIPTSTSSNGSYDITIANFSAIVTP